MADTLTTRQMKGLVRKASRVRILVHETFVNITKREALRLLDEGHLADEERDAFHGRPHNAWDLIAPPHDPLAVYSEDGSVNLTANSY